MSMKKKIKIANIREAFGKEVYNVIDVETGLKYSGYLTMLTRLDCPSNHLRVKIGADDFIIEINTILENGDVRPNYFEYDMDTVRADAVSTNSGF